MFTSLFIFFPLLKRRSHFRRNLFSCVLFQIILFVLLAFYIELGAQNYYFLYTIFLLSFFVTLFILFQGSVTDYLFLYFCSFVLYYGAYAFGLLCGLFFCIPFSKTYPYFCATTFAAMLFLFVTGFAFQKMLSRYSESINVRFSTDILIPCLTCSLLFFCLSRLEAYSTSNSTLVFLYLCRMLTASLLLYMHCVILHREYRVQKQSAKDTEEKILEQLLHESAKQYIQLQQSMEEIYLKSHDLRHLQHLLERKEYLPDAIEELKNITDTYSCSVKTGYYEVDIILTDYSLRCRQHNIDFICIADAKGLSFLPVAELYTLLNNALENAIQYVSSLDSEKRFIRFFIRPVNHFVTIYLENYLEEEPTLKDGLPVTSNPDKTTHGYGLKSILQTVEKYDGCLNISTENHSFSLNIIIPVE